VSQYLEYRQKKCYDLSLRFAPSQEFREVVDAVRSVKLPPISVNAELAAFSVLELLSNSMRAHRERGVQDDVSLCYTLGQDKLEIEILDAGRGFDPSRLPYRLDDPPSRVDPTSEAFTEYRIAHGNGRFGMGLLAARRTFPVFSLSFVDRELKPCPWFSGMVRGTRIVLAAPLVSGGPVSENLDELPLAEDSV
jgi:anti-sigma regulatory factor (Ser/Thr protein kinase)